VFSFWVDTLYWAPGRGPLSSPQLIVSNFTPFSWDQSSQRVTSLVASLETKDNNGKDIRMTNLNKPFTIHLPQRIQQQHFQNETFTLEFGRIVYHKIEFQHGGMTLHINIIPPDNKTMLVLAFGYKERPTKDADYRFVVRGSHRVYVGSQLKPGIYFLGVRFGLDQNDTTFPVPITYKLQVAASACLFWSIDKQKWISDGCKVRRTTFTRTVKH